MVKISLSATGALVAAPNGKFPKLAEIPALRVLWAHEAERLRRLTKRLPIVGRVPSHEVL